MFAFLNPTRLALALAFVALAASPARAQCPQPDGLDFGPPCGPAQLQVPLVKANTDALGICWRDCNIDATQNYLAEWSKPVPTIKAGWGAPACGWFESRLRLYTAAAGNQWVGKMRLHYARTWVEATPITQHQVWRFLVNGDMTPLLATATPCGNPPCAPAFNNRVRFTGYIDYAFDCLSGNFEYAWMLTHACDGIDHAPGFPRAGAFHPDRSYTFVGPGSTFVPAPFTTVEAGPVMFESLRRWDTAPMPPRCTFEERVVQGAFNPLGSGCRCGVGPAQWHFADLTATGGAGSGVFGSVGAFSFTSMGIGRWVNPLTYPGQEELRWNTADLTYVDACIGVALPEIFFGVTTNAGNAPFQIVGGAVGGPLPDMFVDMSSSKKLPLGVPRRNVPYDSDHVLNLNL